MDASMVALRALVSGLRKSGAISDPHITAIVAELEAADKALEHYTGDRVQVRELCMAVAKDADVKTDITTEEPEMGWGH